MWLWCPVMKIEEITMWIYIYPNWKTNFDSKNGRKRSYSYEYKVSISLSQEEECVYGAQSWKELRLLYKSVIAQIDRRILILKMVEI